jgi:two-component sensor histidine kinase
MWRDAIDGWVGRTLTWREWSPSALLLAPVAVLLATLLRLCFSYFGASLYFATFFPAVLIVSLVAGAPAGVLTLLLTIPVVWWAFLPPSFAFGPLAPIDYANFALFIVAGGMTVCLADLYRSTLASLFELQKSREILMHELNHRVGNMLAVTQAIVTGTLSSNRELSDAINGRLRAVSRANVMLFGSAEGAVPLKDLVENELLPFAAGTRLVVAGPPIDLAGETARSIALVLHELTTNSVKYGALSNQEGRVHIQWRVDDHRCFVHWSERDGPAVTPPTASGYGSRMINGSLGAVGGRIKTDFRSDGFSCEISFPIRMAASTDRSAVESPSGTPSFQPYSTLPAPHPSGIAPGYRRKYPGGIRSPRRPSWLR